jgi:hypothetical protein
MQLPISEARTKLPHLIKQLQRNPNVTYEITVHREVVAELKVPLLTIATRSHLSKTKWQILSPLPQCPL